MDFKKSAQNDIILSICCPVYNHEDYVVRALDSVFMQETKYRYEVLVGEDCSTDNSRAILQQYEVDHPGFLTVFYREKNMRGSKIGNSRDLKLRAKGKYIITLECDDFWTDPHKIEKQIDFLETHPEYVAVAHNCTIVDENSNPTGEKYPECKSENYTFFHYLIGIMPGQFATWMQRNNNYNAFYDDKIHAMGLIPGDRLYYFVALCCGKVYCMQESMSAYRHILNGGSSYSATFRYDFKRREKWYRTLLDYAVEMGWEKGMDCIRQLYFNEICYGYRHHHISFQAAKSYIKEINHKGVRIIRYCMITVIKHCLHLL